MKSFRLLALSPSAPGRNGTDAVSSGLQAFPPFSVGRPEPEHRQLEGFFMALKFKKFLPI